MLGKTDEFIPKSIQNYQEQVSIAVQDSYIETEMASRRKYKSIKPNKSSGYSSEDDPDSHRANCKRKSNKYNKNTAESSSDIYSDGTFNFENSDSPSAK